MKHIRPAKRLSGATVHGGIVYLSGQVPDNLDVGIEAQSREVISKIDAILKEAGSDKSKILSATIWLPDISDRDAFNTVWDAWAPEPGPARACVESRLADAKIKVEVAVIAIAG
ncbi:RidA family protein [Bosea sp. 685]|uniref:RidA family protein n=1 Tax=Bosea sp. 685 TaxID=3080057 RepID=UPI0028932E8F|nr:RidA family protein [Bosea sp. 685]WNJ87912.1 RidA family protein [Bosea sp. 685]